MEQVINRGLDGVNIDTSSICFIDGAKGELIYRGYDIRQLADKASFEEVVYLLWNGELPTATQLADFKAGLAVSFGVPEAVYRMLEAAPAETAPMHLLRSAISLLGAFDEAADEVDMGNVKRIGLRLLAQFPTVVAAIQRVRNGQSPIAPHPELGVAGNFLYMLTGEEPTPAATEVMDVALVLHAEHGSNASTFVARATASSLTDVYSAVTAAVGSLKGPLHGGANEAVMEALEEIGDLSGVESYVQGVLSRPGGRVMGFGHRV
ncbi:MAG TPA: citrate/2-methylcitrate synthase, partial [Trueperaceae bacterium]|nr:citrate/2-methylcitrate synthase [Trueperaceae bacterium]